LVRIGPTAWPFTGFIHTYIHTDRQLDKYILDFNETCKTFLYTSLSFRRVKGLFPGPAQI
jgi:hypothetical protein